MNSMHVEHSWVVKAPREKVFETMTDPEGLPKWSTGVISVSGIDLQDNVMQRDVTSKLMGRIFKSHEKHILTTPEKNEFDVTSVGGNRKYVFKFDSVPEGTCIAVTGDFTPKDTLAKLLSSIAKRKFDALKKAELRGFAEYVETGKIKSKKSLWK